MKQGERRVVICPDNFQVVGRAGSLGRQKGSREKLKGDPFR